MERWVCTIGTAILMLVFLVVMEISENGMQASAIKQGCAYYTPDRGVFTWGKQP